MKINRFVWLQFYVEKLAVKHSVETEEVEEVLFEKPLLRRFAKGRLKRIQPSAAMQVPVFDLVAAD